MATSFLAPILRAERARTRSCRSAAKEVPRLPPHGSSLALRSLTPPAASRTCGRDSWSSAWPRRAASAAASGDDLERRAGRLGGGDGEPAEREHRAVAGLDHRDAAELAAQRALRGASAARAGSSCGPSGRACAPPCADHAVAEAAASELRRPAEAVVVDALQAGRGLPAIGRVPAIDAPVGSESSSLPAGVVDQPARGRRPLLRRTSSPLRSPGRRRLGSQATRPLSFSLRRVERQRALTACRSPSCVPSPGPRPCRPCAAAPIFPTVIFSTPAARLARR